jgi:GH15 family glucan-1,4-alpha-glucosidase
MPDSRYLPIEEHAVIGDLRTVALVSTDGTIDWYCPERFDKASVFASLLDADRGGAFQISCPESDPANRQQLYLPDSNILLTRFLAPHAVGEVVDFMVPVDNDDTEAPHVVVRQATAVRGRAAFRLRCHPRFDYGRVPHTVTVRPGAGAIFESPAGTLTLRTSLPLVSDGSGVTCDFELEHGETMDVVLEWGTELRPLRPGHGAVLFNKTQKFWQTWLSQSRYQGRWREMVHRSALLLKLLVYRPSGALIAAPTTSLPEEIGGERNWDYRYTWIRDAAFTVYALMNLGFTEEAAAFMDWLEARCERRPDTGLQVLYRVDGSSVLTEEVLGHLSGYRDTGPVRIGNAAAGQLQLDIYGELMDSVELYDRLATPVSYELWEALSWRLDWLGKHWEEPDEGIWETRGKSQRFTYSALMTWVAFDRAGRIARRRGLPGPVTEWAMNAGRAYEFVQRSWDEKRRAYTDYAGSDRLDASLLCMPVVGFCGPTDRRFARTLETIGNELVSDSLVRRYAVDGSDGLDGDEGTFNLCSFWYAEALTRAGDVQGGRLIFEKMLTYANHVGLYAEEIGPSGEALGNFPQAFTHLALISAAMQLNEALEGRESGRMGRGSGRVL